MGESLRRDRAHFRFEMCQITSMAFPLPASPV